MLILRPVNGVYYVVSSEFPDGQWAAYDNEDSARALIHWLTEMKIDCVGLLTRLHFGRLTETDRRLVNKIQRAARHSSQVVSTKTAISEMMALAKVKGVRL